MFTESDNPSDGEGPLEIEIDLSNREPVSRATSCPFSLENHFNPEAARERSKFFTLPHFNDAKRPKLTEWLRESSRELRSLRKFRRPTLMKFEFIP
jgi:hypothetical protein